MCVKGVVAVDVGAIVVDFDAVNLSLICALLTWRGRQQRF